MFLSLLSQSQYGGTDLLPAGEVASTPSRRPVLLIFMLSGVSGLIYQVIWARQLALIFGNTTTSVTIVLAAFMAGLALGSALAGRSLVQRRNPMQLYAVLEGGIGAYALLFPSLVRGMEVLYSAILSNETPLGVLTLFRATAAFMLMLVPTTMMGATLPLTTEYVHRIKVQRSDWNAGRLYGANTLGAALGSFVSGFILIELLGISMSTLIAAMFNFVVMAIGYRLSRKVADREERSAVPEKQEALEGDLRLLVLFAASGALALAGEVVWTPRPDTRINCNDVRWQK